MDRREAIKTITAAAIGASGLGILGRNPSAAQSPSGKKDSKLKLEIAGYKVDRVVPLADDRVPIKGCELRFVSDSIGAMNSHVLGGAGTREVTEIGLHPFMLAYANEGFRDYTLLPVFPLRAFRHKSIFIRTDRGISTPEDLRGKKIATPGYSSSSLTWIRGILQHEYGVAPTDVDWFVSKKDSSAKVSGGPSKQENVIPKGLNVVSGPEGKDESDMLADGDVDALFHAVEPSCYREGHPMVARLFPDFTTVEQAYYERTGIFPIMHAVAIRNKTVEEYPWLPAEIFSAYSEAKRIALKELDMAWAYNSLPWIAQEVEETRALMGDNFWPYGIEPNRKALEALFRYSHEQGLASRRLEIEDLFHPSTMDLVEG